MRLQHIATDVETVAHQDFGVEGGEVADEGRGGVLVHPLEMEGCRRGCADEGEGLAEEPVSILGILVGYRYDRREAEWCHGGRDMRRDTVGSRSYLWSGNVSERREVSVVQEYAVEFQRQVLHGEDRDIISQASISKA